MADAAYRHTHQDTHTWRRYFHRGPGIARLSCIGHHYFHVYWLPCVVPRFLLCLLMLGIVADYALLLQSTLSGLLFLLDKITQYIYTRLGTYAIYTA